MDSDIAPGKRTILIASSRKLFSDAIGAHLRNMGMDVLSAPTGDERIELLHHRVSGVILDATIPGMQNFLMRVQKQHPNVTVALVSDLPIESEIGRGVIPVLPTQGLAHMLSIFGIQPQGIPSALDDTIVIAGRKPVLDSLHRTLEAQGLTALAAAEAGEVEQLFENGRIRVLVLDLLLAGGGGLDILRSLKERFPATEIIMVGHSDNQIAQLAMELGAFDYVHEPFDQQTIYSSIEAALSHSHFQEESASRHYLWPFGLHKKDGEGSDAKAEMITKRRQLVHQLEELGGTLTDTNPQVAAAVESCINRAAAGDVQCPVGQLYLSDYLLTGYLHPIAKPVGPSDAGLGRRLETENPQELLRELFAYFEELAMDHDQDFHLALQRCRENRERFESCPLNALFNIPRQAPVS